MKPPVRASGSASLISETFNRRLNHYALAASAAGAGLLTMAQPAKADIVFTPANVNVTAPGGTYDLDLNNDGIPDFVWHGFGDGVVDAFIEVDVAGAGAAIQSSKTCNGTLGTYCSYAAALNQGDTIPGKRMAIDGVTIERANKAGSSFTYRGFWHNVKNHFLGFKFKINGQTHYGWARLSIRTAGASVTAHISGYAYETVANKSIRAGQKAGADFSTPDENGSLGALARGVQSAGR